MSSSARRLVLALASGLVLVFSAGEAGRLPAATAAPSPVNLEQESQLDISSLSIQGVPPDARYGDWQRVFGGNWR